MTTHSASSPSTQTLLSTSQVPPSREKVPDVTRWFTVSITLILGAQRTSSRISTRGKPPATDLVSAET